MLKNSAMSFVMGFLFLGGIGIAGGESKYWPWNVVLGVLMFATFAFMARKEFKVGSA